MIPAPQLSSSLAAVSRSRDAGRQCAGPFGYFDEPRREYVITRPDLPTPWINYLGLEAYCALISNTAGGYSFHLDPRDRRLLRFRYNHVPMDRPGRYLFLRDEARATFWSLTWQPTCQALGPGAFECRHGLGYTTIRTRVQGLDATVEYLVPPRDPVELWTATLRNTGRLARQLSLFSYAEFCILQALMDQTDFQYTLNIAKAVRSGRLLLHLTNYFPDAGRRHLAFFGVDRALSGFDCDREAFLGPYQGEGSPQVVAQGRSRNSIASGGNPIGSHWIRLRLRPGQSTTIRFVLGASVSPAHAARMTRRYTRPSAARKARAELAASWERYLSHMRVQTPEPGVDLLINTWNAYQCRVTFNWSRSASYYESGIGRGMGFRDSNQDTLGVVHAIPDRVRARILTLARNQFARGDAYHQYFPLTGQGDKTGYSDDHLWLIVSTMAYLKETGEYVILKTRTPFVDGPPASLYEHLARALNYSYAQLGPHELPLIGVADWNDCLNPTGPRAQAESVWVAEFLYYVTNEMIALARRLGCRMDAARWARKAARLRVAVNRHAWDGAWFIRAFDDRRRPIGSHRCREGKIHLNAQSWAVISGITTPDRARRCMDAVRRFLDSPHGIRLCAPAYTTYDPSVGAVGTFEPGLKENGGIFCHANPWAMMAEALLGRADRAFTYYRKIAPTFRNRLADVHQAEGYVYPQFIAAPPHRDAGRARNSWLTGSAAWNYVFATQYLLGVRPTLDGLLLDPCLPQAWPGFCMQRIFRGARYDIHVRRARAGYRGMRVDGRPVPSRLVPVFRDRRVHRVELALAETRNGSR